MSLAVRGDDVIVSEDWLLLIDRLEAHYTRYGNGNLANQIIKVQEELGEAAEAYVGWCGLNPRKGTTHTRDDIAMELADVMLTAALAIKYAGFDVNAVLDRQAQKTVERLDDYDERR